MKIDEEHPHSLAEILDLGLLHNTDTMRSWSEARVAAANYGQTLKNDFIISQFDTNFTREKSPQTITVNGNGEDVDHVDYTTYFTNELSLSYLILDFGQTRSTSQSALYSLYQADWTHNSNIQSVLQTLMDDYFDVLYQKELLFSYDADVINAATTLESAQEKLRTGTADVSDVLQARSNYLDYKLKTVNQEQYLNTSYATLTHDMGISSHIDLHLQGFPTQYNPYTPRPFDELLQLAKTNRPDYLAAQADVKAKEWGVTAAKRKYYPKLTSDFSIGNTQGNHNLHDNYDFNLELRLSVPLFQGFFQQNELRKKEASLQTAKADLLNVELTMTKEIDIAQKNITYALESIDFATQYLDTSKEDFRVSMDKYRQGTNTIIDVINAQTNIANASAKLIQAKKDYFTSLANLAYAIGSLNIKEFDHETSE